VVQQQSHDAPNHIMLEALPPSQHSADDTASNESPDGFAALEKWNQPQINVYRTFATFFSFLVMGANDAAYGVRETTLWP
jgi:hypothetical protein